MLGTCLRHSATRNIVSFGEASKGDENKGSQACMKVELSWKKPPNPLYV